ncbi:MAG: hypothetical protein M3371_07545 [Acidobacteriota bacterium]|nr:hypothetical protein [Acidobacteriota bacterium]
MMLKLFSIALALALATIGQEGTGQSKKKRGTATRKASGTKTNGTKMSSIQTGMWGGPHVRMEITERGAQIEFDCAHGAIEQPLALDGKGRFDVKGEYVIEHGGPERAGGPELAGPPSPAGRDARPARYTGSMTNGTLTLAVTLTDTQEKIGPFTLTRGAMPRLVKCL